ncbi:MAG TPA: hypothetical protein PK961_08475 [bacterium]|nr:hypothetical protein [bacterium]
MTAIKSRGTVLSLLLALMLLTFATACVEIETDPEPPYPIKDRDYSYPEQGEPTPPWEEPGQYPVVKITAPADGEFFPAGAVTVTGTYQGPALSSLTINGRTIALNGANFSAEVTLFADDLAAAIVVTATTADDIVAADRVTVFQGTAQALTERVENALLVDLENRGLAAISGVLSTALDGLDIAGLLAPEVAADPQLKALVEIEEAVLGNIDINLASVPDALNLTLLGNDVYLKMSLLGFLDIELTINGLYADLLANLSVDSENNLVFDITEGDFAIGDFEIASPLIPEGLAGTIGTVVELLSPLLYDLLLNNLIVDEINGLLDGLSLAIDIPPFSYEFIPTTAEYADRNMVLGLDTLISAAAKLPTDFQPDGFLVTDSDRPEFAEFAPNQAPYGIALALNDDMLNQLLYLVAASGTLDFTVEEDFLDAELLSLIFWSFENVPDDMNVYLEFAPSVAPITIGDPVTAQLHIPAYTMRVMVDRGALGPWEAMSFAIDVSVPLDIIRLTDNAISLGLGEIGFDLRALHNAVGQANIANLNRLMEELLGDLLPELLGGLSNMEITLPPLLGVTADIADIAGIGPSNDFVGIFLDLQFL